MVNLITRMVTVCRLYGDSENSDTYFGLIWRLSGVFMEKTW